MADDAGEVAAGEPVPTLFEWAGGDAAIRRLIDAFYDRVEADDVLSPFFPGGVTAEHRDHVSMWWAGRLHPAARRLRADARSPSRARH
jgi:truncated hemoglobin YjbI